MFSKLERKIAFRYLGAKRRGFGSVISWVSLIGIMLGVATLIVVMSVMGGFHDTLLGRIIGMNGHVVVYHQDGAISDFDFLIDKMKQNKIVSTHATSIVPIAEGQVMATAGGNNTGAMIRGIRMSDLQKKTNSGTRIYGKPLDGIRDGELVAGASLTRALRVTMGDNISLVSANAATPTPFGSMPRIMSYPVMSSFFMGMYEYDSGYIFMPLETAQKYLNIGNAVTHIDLFLENPEDTTAVQKSLLELLPDGFVVRDWRELNRGFVGALQVESNVMFLILMLIVIVAAFNIISSLVMLVKDKNKDIAVLRTFGVSRKSMMRIFILSGTSIGVIGTFFGTIFGVLIAIYIEPIRQFVQMLTGRDLFPAELYYLSELPSKLELTSVAGIAVLAIALSFLATLYPAWKAANTDPVEVLRNE
ncbi:MAG: lipoprotein-releasing ABC transporter permease subunit [Alphaproteobacteria bacterium]|nr:lipoprotein-releasing ABC transporter permease subunit [Alphaproteobacteria bacterium]MBQ3039405.1 lipoprotein-releasing ABC transporter permease subunit [Alphaproteobacteria bacterium]MBQ7127970.1 lipoprotein-releasing ABC transporter permease subunit [Alphaproteobacteria bacterium]